MNGRGGGWITGILVLVMLGLATSQRIHVTDVPDEQLLGVDAWFHVRMAQYTADHFPRHLREDGAAFFPDVRRQEVSGIMNVVHAAVIRMDLLFGGSGSVRSSAFRTGRWMPVGLALGVFLLVFLLGRQLGGRRVGLGGMALLLLVPGTFLARSAVGFLDQHVLETLLALAIPAGMIAALRSGGRWPVVVATGQLPVVFLLSWLGASVYFLHMTVMAAVVLLAWNEDVQRASTTLAAWFLSAAAGYLMITIALPDWPLEMRPGLRWAFPVAFLVLAAGSTAFGRPGRRHRRWGAVGIVLAAGTLALWGVEPLRELVFRAFERQPMDIIEVDVTVGNVFRLFGAVVPLALVGWVGHVRHGTPVERGVAAWTFMTVVLWLSSGDYDYVPPAFMALYGALGFRNLLAGLRGRATSTETREMRAGAIILMLLLVLPIQPFGWVRNPLSIADSREAIPLYSPAWQEAMMWMRTNTPPPARPRNAPWTEEQATRARASTDAQAPDYGVMSGWLYGNAVLELGHRSPTFARYPSRFEPAWFLSTTPEEERRFRCPTCRSGQRVAFAVVDADQAADGYAFLRMNAEERKHLDALAGPVFDSAYEAALVTRLVTDPTSVPGMTVVYQSPDRQVLYWDTHPETGERWRRLAPLDSRAGASVHADTVHTVQIFALHDGPSRDVATEQAPLPHPDTLAARSAWNRLGRIVPERTAVAYTPEPPVLDGRIDDSAWQSAVWSHDFRDIEGPDHQPDPPFRTRMAMRWDATYLYVAADMEEPHLWASITDSLRPMWHDKDFEVFVDPDGDNHHYFELEINAFNKTNEVHFPRPYGDEFEPEDRLAWMDGLISANRFEGTLNDRRDRDERWTMEIALPWSGFARYGTDGGPPRPGTTWRMNFSRVNWDLLPDSAGIGYIRNGPPMGHNWTWSPQGQVMMHLPEMWGYVQFRMDHKPPTLPDPFHVRARACLMDAYYRNRVFRSMTGRNARRLEELFGPRAGPTGSGACEHLEFDIDGDGFLLSLTDTQTGRTATVDQRRHLSIPGEPLLDD